LSGFGGVKKPNLMDTRPLVVRHFNAAVRDEVLDWRC
jgi:hypothetical protein